MMAGRAMHPPPGGPNGQLASQPIPSEQIVEIRRYGPTQISDQPWTLGAVTSRPSFESSLRAIRRSRPIARKMRRRLMALAGATDKTINGKTHDKPIVQ